MQTTDSHQQPPPAMHEREDEPGALPVEPDEGPLPAVIPDDPEQQRVILPEGDRARPVA